MFDAKACVVQAAPAKEKPKRKGPLEALPDLLEDWATYDAPDEVGISLHACLRVCVCVCV